MLTEERKSQIREEFEQHLRAIQELAKEDHEIGIIGCGVISEEDLFSITCGRRDMLTKSLTSAMRKQDIFKDLIMDSAKMVVLSTIVKDKAGLLSEAVSNLKNKSN